MSFRDEAGTHRQFALPGARLHYGPDKTVDVLHIDLHLEPDLEACSLDGICTTTIRAIDEPVEYLALDAVDLQVSAVELDGSSQRYESRDAKLYVTFDPPLPADAG